VLGPRQRAVLVFASSATGPVVDQSVVATVDLERHAHSSLDVAIDTLAAEAGTRLSEVRGLKVRNVNFGVGVVRFEDGFTTRGGHAGKKGDAFGPCR
jgi:hypothetical protein